MNATFFRPGIKLISIRLSPKQIFFTRLGCKAGNIGLYRLISLIIANLCQAYTLRAANQDAATMTTKTAVLYFDVTTMQLRNRFLAPLNFFYSIISPGGAVGSAA